MRLGILFASAVLATATFAHAFAASWPKEPSSFLGIGIDSPFPGAIPQCPLRGSGALAVVDHVALTGRKDLCFAPPYGELFQIHGLPDLGFAYKLAVFAYQGKAGSLMLETSSSNYNKLRELLITRYGQPSRRIANKVKTTVGATFDSEQLLWSGRAVEIVLDQLSGDVNTSHVFVSSAAYRQYQASAAKKKVINNASKL